MKYYTMIEDQSLEMDFSKSLNRMSINSKKNIEIDCVKLSHNSYSLILNDQSHYLTIIPHLQGYNVIVDHYSHLVNVQNELDVLLEEIGLQSNEETHQGKIYAQIPGLISQIFVREGDTVEVNQKLFILEAMKMENEIDSPIKGKVKSIYCISGDKIDKGSILMEIIT